MDLYGIWWTGCWCSGTGLVGRRLMLCPNLADLCGAVEPGHKETSHLSSVDFSTFAGYMVNADDVVEGHAEKGKKCY
jgi:hypothetical protein